MLQDFTTHHHAAAVDPTYLLQLAGSGVTTAKILPNGKRGSTFVVVDVVRWCQEQYKFLWLYGTLVAVYHCDFDTTMSVTISETKADWDMISNALLFFSMAKLSLKIWWCSRDELVSLTGPLILPKKPWDLRMGSDKIKIKFIATGANHGWKCITIYHCDPK